MSFGSCHGFSGLLDTTVRVKYTLSAHPTLTDASSIGTLLTPLGSLDKSTIVLSLKPAPPKKPKRGTALVPFKQIGGAFAAVCASGRAESGLKDIEIDWAEGKEPELIGWLKKMGHLGGAPGKDGANKANYAPPPASEDYNTSTSTSTSVPSAQLPPSDLAFSSFPSTFVCVRSSLIERCAHICYSSRLHSSHLCPLKFRAWTLNL